MATKCSILYIEKVTRVEVHRVQARTHYGYAPYIYTHAGERPQAHPPHTAQGRREGNLPVSIFDQPAWPLPSFEINMSILSSPRCEKDKGAEGASNQDE
jgi:hypothetical protein